MLPADSAPPGGAGQSVSHGSALVQLDPTIYSSSPGNSGLMAVSQSLDFVTEDLESTSVQLLRCFFLYPVPLFLKFSSIHFPVFSNMFLMFQCFLNSHGNGGWCYQAHFRK